MQRPTFLFSGGGTGGHLFPGIAVADQLRARDGNSRIIFVGSQREVEHEILSAGGYEHFALPVESSTASRRRPVRFAWRMWRSYRLARGMLRKAQPNCVIGLGGFASVPVVLAAWRGKIPIVLLEQNVVPGRATSLLSRFATSICLPFAKPASGLAAHSFVKTTQRLAARTNAHVTGNPVRREIAALHDTADSEPKSSPPTLLVLGGSQGAVAVNDAMLQAVDKLRTALDGWRIVHQTGKRNIEQIRNKYRSLGLNAQVEPFFSDLCPPLRAAAIVVSRAGATTLAELACAGSPAILIPYPNSVRDHQRANAAWYTNAGAACIVEQNAEPQTTAESLATRLTALLADTKQRGRMRQAMHALAKPAAAGEVANRILQQSR